MLSGTLAALCLVAGCNDPCPGGVCPGSQDAAARADLASPPVSDLAEPVEGGAPMVRALPASLGFADTAVGAASPVMKVKLANQGNVHVSLDLASLAGADAADFVIEADGCMPPIQLAPGASCELGVRFSPKSMGQKSAKVKFSFGGMPPDIEVPMSGRATGA